MRPSDRMWLGISAAVAGTVAVLDVRCDRRRDESTLSCGTRRLVQLVPGGEVLFMVGLGAFAHHILEPLHRPEAAPDVG